jgi:hypothetical protein
MAQITIFPQDPLLKLEIAPAYQWAILPANLNGPDLNRHLLNLEDDGFSLFIPQSANLHSQDLSRWIEKLKEDPYWGAITPMNSSHGFNGLGTSVSPEEMALLEGVLEKWEITDFLDETFFLVKNSVLKLVLSELDFSESLHLMCNQMIWLANRLGFQCLVDQSLCLASGSDFSEKYLAKYHNDLFARVKRFPESHNHLLHWQKSGIASQRRLARQWLCDLRSNKISCLIDLSNLSPVHNGTSQAMLQFLQHLPQDQRFEYRILVNKAGASFHQLKSKYSQYRMFFIGEQMDEAVSTLFFRIGQPWFFADLQRMRSLGVFVADYFLDTISLDCHYIKTPILHFLWEKLAESSDFLVFNSEYTRNIFLRRFSQCHAKTQVCYHSTKLDDYKRNDHLHGTSPEKVLVIGNHLHHKMVDQTVDEILKEFPPESIVCLGIENKKVQSFRSGHLSEEELEKLYSSASVVVFPSVYEGFGFPIFEAVGNNKRVVVRESELVNELLPFLPSNSVQTFKSLDKLNSTLKVAISLKSQTYKLEGLQGKSWLQTHADLIEYFGSAILSQKATPQVLTRWKALKFLDFTDWGITQYYDQSLPSIKNRNIQKLGLLLEHFFLKYYKWSYPLRIAFRLLKRTRSWLRVKNK